MLHECVGVEGWKGSGVAGTKLSFSSLSTLEVPPPLHFETAKLALIKPWTFAIMYIKLNAYTKSDEIVEI